MKYNADEGTRTPNLTLRTRLLYPLSYVGMVFIFYDITSTHLLYPLSHRPSEAYHSISVLFIQSFELTTHTFPLFGTGILGNFAYTILYDILSPLF